MPAEDTGTVEVAREDDIAVVTLRRERKRNALSTHMENALLRALRSPEVESSPTQPAPGKRAPPTLISSM